MFLERFVNYLQYEKRYSPHTINAYRKDLDQFLEYLSAQDCTVSSVTHFEVRSWLVHLMEHDLDSRSINRKVSSLRTYFKFLLREQLVSATPMVKVQAPKTAKRLPVIVEGAKISALLDSSFFAEDFAGLRDRVVIEVLFGTGMRLSELIALKESDVNGYEQSVKVLGKRSKERIIPLNSSLMRLLNNYLEQKKKVCENPSLIVTDRGETSYSKHIYRIVNKYLSLVSTQTKKSPHVLRHAFATCLLNNGAELNSIKELLGHSSLAATQVYTHNSVERLKAIYKQAHPKA